MKLIDKDGNGLDLVMEYPKSDRERYPLCIIVHGFTGNKEERHILAVSDMMREIGMATIRVDMYGHGESDGLFVNHTLYHWISDVLEVIDYARSMPEVSRIYLCGHSQGGLAVVMAGSVAQDMIDGIIPLSPALTIPEGARKGNILGTRVDLSNIPVQFTSEDGWTLGANYVRTASTLYPRKALRSYKGPVLMVHGEADESVPIGPVREYAKCCKRCTFVPIAGETHCYDNHLDRVLEVVRSYLVAEEWNR